MHRKRLSVINSQRTLVLHLHWGCCPFQWLERCSRLQSRKTKIHGSPLHAQRVAMIARLQVIFSSIIDSIQKEFLVCSQFAASLIPIETFHTIYWIQTTASENQLMEPSPVLIQLWLQEHIVLDSGICYHDPCVIVDGHLLLLGWRAAPDTASEALKGFGIHFVFYLPVQGWVSKSTMMPLVQRFEQVSQDSTFQPLLWIDRKAKQQVWFDMFWRYPFIFFVASWNHT